MADSGGMSINPDAFMQLFVTQMKYQDPTAPMDSSAMMGQLAQLTTVQQLKSMNSAFQGILQAEQLGLARELIGSQVSFADGMGVHTGVVESAAMQDGAAGVFVENTFVPVNDISGILGSAN